MTEGFEGDSPQFATLVNTTARDFAMSEVSADKAYLSNANLQVVVDNHAKPYIPFKTNAEKNEWRGPATVVGFGVGFTASAGIMNYN